MRRGVSPKVAAEQALLRIARRVPGYTGALFAVTKDGRWAGAAVGFATYAVSYQDGASGGVKVVEIPPLQPPFVQEPSAVAEPPVE